MPDVRIRPPRIAAALAIGTLFLAAGCGGSEKPDPARGKELFTQRCGACHILENAGTKGVQGPNLDLAFKQSVADGLGRSTIEGVVRKQIALPQGDQMPAESGRGQGRRRGGCLRGERDRKEGLRRRRRPVGHGEGGRQEHVQIPRTRTVSSRTSSRAPRQRPGRRRSSRRTIRRCRTTSRSREGPRARSSRAARPPRSAVDLKPGKETFYCSVPGHEQAGMKGTLTVK